MYPSRRSVLLGVFLAGAACLAVAAEDTDTQRDQDQDRARRAVQAGEALPLDSLMPIIAGRLGGEIAGVSFEREGGGWVYEFKVITPSGRLIEVQVDAKSARVLRREDE